MKKTRCSWCEKDDLYRDYHDKEWGKPVYDDAVFFEFIVLESFQAGLSWYTILKKREHFKKVFDQFDYKKIAEYDERKVNELLEDPGIIRNRLKVLATITNAKSFQAIQQEFGSFTNYIWSFTNHEIIDQRPQQLNDVPAKTELSDTIAKDLKKRGFKFMGSTVVYAFLQATGIINDHVADCFTKN